MPLIDNQNGKGSQESEKECEAEESSVEDKTPISSPLKEQIHEESGTKDDERLEENSNLHICGSPTNGSGNNTNGKLEIDNDVDPVAKVEAESSGAPCVDPCEDSASDVPVRGSDEEQSGDGIITGSDAEQSGVDGVKVKGSSGECLEHLRSDPLDAWASKLKNLDLEDEFNHLPDGVSTWKELRQMSFVLPKNETEREGMKYVEGQGWQNHKTLLELRKEQMIQFVIHPRVDLTSNRNCINCEQRKLRFREDCSQRNVAKSRFKVASLEMARQEFDAKQEEYAILLRFMACYVSDREMNKLTELKPSLPDNLPAAQMELENLNRLHQALGDFLNILYDCHPGKLSFIDRFVSHPIPLDDDRANLMGNDGYSENDTDEDSFDGKEGDLGSAGEPVHDKGPSAETKDADKGPSAETKDADEGSSAETKDAGKGLSAETKDAGKGQSAKKSAVTGSVSGVGKRNIQTNRIPSKRTVPESNLNTSSSSRASRTPDSSSQRIKSLKSRSVPPTTSSSAQKRWQ